MKKAQTLILVSILAVSAFGSESGVFKDIKESTGSYGIDSDSALKSGLSFWWSASDDGKMWLYGTDSNIQVAIAKGVASFDLISSPSIYTFSNTPSTKLQIGEIAILKNSLNGHYAAIKPTKKDGLLLSGEWRILEQFTEYRYAKNPIDKRCTIFASFDTTPKDWQPCTKYEYEQENTLRTVQAKAKEKLNSMPSGWSIFGSSSKLDGNDLPESVKKIARYDASSGNWGIIDTKDGKSNFESNEYEGFWIYK